MHVVASRFCTHPPAVQQCATSALKLSLPTVLVRLRALDVFVVLLVLKIV